jgi:hypothetical protein
MKIDLITVLVFILSICLGPVAYATNFNPVEKTYILRITSQNPNKKVVPFTGSYVVTGKNGYRVIHFLFADKPMERLFTPYEETVKGSAISTMIVSVNDPQVDNIKVEILEKENDRENSIMSGTGLTIVSTNDANLVFNNIYAK